MLSRSEATLGIASEVRQLPEDRELVRLPVLSDTGPQLRCVERRDPPRSPRPPPNRRVAPTKRSSQVHAPATPGLGAGASAGRCGIPLAAPGEQRRQMPRRAGEGRPSPPHGPRPPPARAARRRSFLRRRGRRTGPRRPRDREGARTRRRRASPARRSRAPWKPGTLPGSGRRLEESRGGGPTAPRAGPSRPRKNCCRRARAPTAAAAASRKVAPDADQSTSKEGTTRSRAPGIDGSGSKRAGNGSRGRSTGVRVRRAPTAPIAARRDRVGERPLRRSARRQSGTRARKEDEADARDDRRAAARRSGGRCLPSGRRAGAGTRSGIVERRPENGSRSPEGRRERPPRAERKSRLQRKPGAADEPQEEKDRDAGPRPDRDDLCGEQDPLGRGTRFGTRAGSSPERGWRGETRPSGGRESRRSGAAAPRRLRAGWPRARRSCPSGEAGPRGPPPRPRTRRRDSRARAAAAIAAGARSGRGRAPRAAGAFSSTGWTKPATRDRPASTRTFHSSFFSAWKKRTTQKATGSGPEASFSKEFAPPRREDVSRGGGRRTRGSVPSPPAARPANFLVVGEAGARIGDRPVGSEVHAVGGQESPGDADRAPSGPFGLPRPGIGARTGRRNGRREQGRRPAASQKVRRGDRRHRRCRAPRRPAAGAASRRSPGRRWKGPPRTRSRRAAGRGRATPRAAAGGSPKRPPRS